MELKEFSADQKQLVDDFCAWYESRRRKKGLTMIRPVEQWRELYADFREIYEDGNREQQNEHYSTESTAQDQA
jgi:hypothetical protein